MSVGNFVEFDDIVHILQHICESDRFIKLIYNTDTDPENTDLPVSPSGYELVKFKNLYPFMKIVDVSEIGANVYVNIYYAKSSNQYKTKAYKTNHLFVDVYVHQDLWEIESGIRTYKILNEIDKKLNGTTIPTINSSFTFEDLRPLPAVNTKYAGYSIGYRRVDLGVGCDEI